jgi:hypothetical protein
MSKQVLKILSLTTAFNCLMTFWGIEMCSAQLISGNNCQGSDGYNNWTCFTNFSSNSLPYTLPVQSYFNCEGGNNLGTITLSVPATITFPAGMSVNLDQMTQVSSGSTIQPGTYSLVWGVTSCISPDQFTFAAVSMATPQKGKVSLKKK